MSAPQRHPRSIDAVALWRHLMPPAPLSAPDPEVTWDDLACVLADLPSEMWSAAGRPRSYVAAWFALANHERIRRPKEMHRCPR